MKSVEYFQRKPWPVVLIVMVGLIVFAYIVRTPNVTNIENIEIQREEAEDIDAPNAPEPSEYLRQEEVVPEPELRSGNLDQQMRVRANLDEFHNAQQFFFTDYEHYTTDLLGLGWSPTSAVMNYKLGFLSPSAPLEGDVDTSMMTSDVYLSEVDPFTEKNYSYMTDAARINLSQYSSLCRQGCTANENGFELMIAVPVDNQGHADVWLLNHRKELVQVWDGARGQTL